jgi:copper(I)-binding protein
MRWHCLPALLALSVSLAAQAADVTVSDAWIRASVQGQGSTGAFMTLTAREPLVLTGVSTPVASTAEVHEMRMDGDVMRMRALDGGLPLAPGKPVQLGPGSYHIMLNGLKAPLQPRTVVPMTLRFRNGAGQVSEVHLSLPVSAMRPGS